MHPPPQKKRITICQHLRPMGLNLHFHFPYYISLQFKFFIQRIYYLVIRKKVVKIYIFKKANQAEVGSLLLVCKQ